METVSPFVLLGTYVVSQVSSWSLPPANEVCEGYVFTGVCLSTPGGHAWFYLGGMHGFIRGGMRGFIRGDVHGFIWGACVVLFGFIRGACMVLFGGHAWFYLGGACMVLFRGVCMVLFGGACMVFSVFFGYNEIRSMSGRYASYWNAFLLPVKF